MRSRSTIQWGDHGKEIVDEHNEVVHHAADIARQQSRVKPIRVAIEPAIKPICSDTPAAWTNSVNTSLPKLSVPSGSTRTFGTGPHSRNRFGLRCLPAPGARAGVLAAIIAPRWIKTSERGIQPDIIIALGIRHPGDIPLGVKIFIPLIQKFCGIGDINLAFRNPKFHQPILYSQRSSLPNLLAIRLAAASSRFSIYVVLAPMLSYTFT